MLSRANIYKELGNGICIYPLNTENIKENSINVTASEYAWTTGNGVVCWCGGNEFHIESKIDGKKIKKRYEFYRGSKSVFDVKSDGKKYLILLPHSTTVIETLEVVALGNNIGGAVHSKVSIVAKGVGDTGTMLGPGYCGHLMLSLHNITDDVIALPINSTFVSLTFDYLETPVQRTSITSPSHYDRLLELKFKISEDDQKYFSQDWKGNFESIQTKLCESDEFKKFEDTYKKYKLKVFKKWFTIKRILSIVAFFMVTVFIGYLAYFADKKLGTSVWEERFWTVLIANIIGCCLPGLFNSIFNRR